MIKKNYEKINNALGAAFLSALLVSLLPFSGAFFMLFLAVSAIALAIASSENIAVAILSIALAAVGLFVIADKSFAAAGMILTPGQVTMAIIAILILYAPAGVVTGICLKKKMSLKITVLYAVIAIAAVLALSAAAGIYITNGKINLEIIRNLISNSIANILKTLKPTIDTYSTALPQNSSEIIAELRTLLQTTMFSIIIAFLEVFSFAVVYFTRKIVVRANLMTPGQINKQPFRISKEGAIVFLVLTIISLLDLGTYSLVALNITNVLFLPVCLGGALLLYRKAKQKNTRALIYFYLFIAFTLLPFNDIAKLVLSAIGIFDAIKNNKT